MIEDALRLAREGMKPYMMGQDENGTAVMVDPRDTIATSESLFRLRPSNRKQYGSPPTPVRHGQNKA